MILKKINWGIIKQNISIFVDKNFMLLGVIISIIFAKFNPHFAASGGVLRPELTINMIGVPIIFLITGKPL